MDKPDDKPVPMCKEPMSPERYQAALLCVFQSAQFIGMTDVPDLLSRIERAHSFGALLDPTLYREKVQAMEQDKEMLEAALPLWRWAKRLEERVHAQAAAALEAAIERGLTHPLCGGTYQRNAVSNGTCGTVWGPPTCSNCGAILAEDGA